MLNLFLLSPLSSKIVSQNSHSVYVSKQVCFWNVDTRKSKSELNKKWKYAFTKILEDFNSPKKKSSDQSIITIKTHVCKGTEIRVETRDRDQLKVCFHICRNHLNNFYFSNLKP